MLHFNDPPNIEHRYNTSIMDKPKSPQPVVFHRAAINLATTMSWFVFWTTLPYVGLRLMAEAPVEPLALVALVLAGMRITWGAPWRRVILFRFGRDHETLGGRRAQQETMTRYWTVQHPEVWQRLQRGKQSMDPPWTTRTMPCFVMRTPG